MNPIQSKEHTGKDCQTEPKAWVPRKLRHVESIRQLSDTHHWARTLKGRTGLLWALAITILLSGSASTKAASLWKAESARSIIADRRGQDIGDIITILIQESSSKSKDASTKTAKKSATDMSISSFLFAPQASGLLTKGGNLPALKYGSSKTFDGGGAIKNSDSISARIAVRVIDKLPNGNLIVEGRRLTTFSDELQEMILRGVVRGADITSANTVFSYNIADASIHFVSKGALTAEQKKGWFTKFVDKVSPF